MCVSSYASTKYINYNDFVHFNYKQKVRTIELIHEYLIEYEKLENYEKIEQKEKYQTYLKIIDLFIDSAYADGSPFSLANNPGTLDLCYYGGWLSASHGAAGNRRCLHPGDLSHYLSFARSNPPRPANYDIIERISEKYNGLTEQDSYRVTINEDAEERIDLSEEVGSCSGTNDIICNPSIYGLIEGNTICVAGNRQQGANSSLLCTQALNILRDRDPEKYSATMNGIITQAQSSNADTRDEFFYTLRSMYDTCLCGSVSSVTNEDGTVVNRDALFSRSINANYASKLYNERTCFGIINQTQHIFDYLSTQERESPTCQQFINTPINGSSGVDWLSYLDRANRVIREQGINEIIQSITSQISGARLTQEEADRLGDSDRDEFRSIREDHFQTYYRENLCPLGNDEFIPPTQEINRVLTIQLENTNANADGDNAMVTATYTENGEDKTQDDDVRENIQLIVVDPANAELTNQDSGVEPIWQVSIEEESYEVTAILIIDGESVRSNSLVIPARATAPEGDGDGGDDTADDASTDDTAPRFVITLDNTEANRAGDTAMVLVKYFVNNIDVTMANKDFINLIPVSPATHELSDQTSDGDTLKKYRVPRVENVYKVKATHSENNVTSNELDIPALASDEEEEETPAQTASCEVKLKVSPGQNGRFSIAVEIKAPNSDGVMTTYPNEDNDMPEGLNLTWHDSVNSTPSTSAPPTTSSGNMISDDPPAASASSESTENAAITRIERDIPRSSQYNVAENETPYSVIPFSQGPSERRIGVVIRIGDSCEAGQSVTIPGRNNQRTRPVNNSPVKLNRPQIRQAMPGMILRGQR